MNAMQCNVTQKKKVLPNISHIDDRNVVWISLTSSELHIHLPVFTSFQIYARQHSHTYALLMDPIHTQRCQKFMKNPQIVKRKMLLFFVY